MFFRKNCLVNVNMMLVKKKKKIIIIICIIKKKKRRGNKIKIVIIPKRGKVGVHITMLIDRLMLIFSMNMNRDGL